MDVKFQGVELIGFPGQIKVKKQLSRGCSYTILNKNWFTNNFPVVPRQIMLKFQVKIHFPGVIWIFWHFFPEAN